MVGKLQIERLWKNRIKKDKNIILSKCLCILFVLALGCNPTISQQAKININNVGNPPVYTIIDSVGKDSNNPFTLNILSEMYNGKDLVLDIELIPKEDWLAKNVKLSLRAIYNGDISVEKTFESREIFKQQLSSLNLSSSQDDLVQARNPNNELTSEQNSGNSNLLLKKSFKYTAKLSLEALTFSDYQLEVQWDKEDILSNDPTITAEIKDSQLDIMNLGCEIDTCDYSLTFSGDLKNTSDKKITSVALDLLFSYPEHLKSSFDNFFMKSKTINLKEIEILPSESKRFKIQILKSLPNELSFTEDNLKKNLKATIKLSE